MKVLNSRIHAVIDYIFVVFLWLSPSMLELPQNVGIMTYLLGGVHLALTLSTNFEFGLIKVIPFKIHGWIELVVSFTLVGLAFYLGKTENELCQNFYFFLAGSVFLTWILSDYSDNNNPK